MIDDKHQYFDPGTKFSTRTQHYLLNLITKLKPEPYQKFKAFKII